MDIRTFTLPAMYSGDRLVIERNGAEHKKQRVEQQIQPVMPVYGGRPCNHHLKHPLRYIPPRLNFRAGSTSRWDISNRSAQSFLSRCPGLLIRRSVVTAPLGNVPQALEHPLRSNWYSSSDSKPARIHGNHASQHDTSKGDRRRPVLTLRLHRFIVPSIEKITTLRIRRHATRYLILSRTRIFISSASNLKQNFSSRRGILYIDNHFQYQKVTDIHSHIIGWCGG